MVNAGPDTKTAACQELADELRRVKCAAGLSFADLQSRTPYSKSSLERYVNGKLFPRRDAVQAMAKACDADPERLLKLWDAAAETPEPATVVAAKPRRRWRFQAIAGVAALVVGLGVLSLSTADRGASTASPTSTPPSRAQANDEWSRKLSVFTTEGPAKGGWFEATVDWHVSGDRIYDGRVHGTVRDRAADGLCAVADAWYDGQIVTLGQACGPGSGQPVTDEFRRIQRALVRVCLREDTTVEPVDCSDWS
jgi:transcriptional regulator with XRE-family HTH domain